MSYRFDLRGNQINSVPMATNDAWICSLSSVTLHQEFYSSTTLRYCTLLYVLYSTISKMGLASEDRYDLQQPLLRPGFIQ